MTSQTLCAACQIPASKSCSLCNSSYYCSKEHQEDDWKKHKKICVPFKIQTSLRLGRHLIATRNITEGEIVMRKYPVVVGPKMASYPLCLGCHERLSGVFYNCSKCSWPLCGSGCEKSDYHLLECDVFSRNNFRPQVSNNNTKQGIYSMIVPLRSILLKNTNKSQYDIMMNMQSHLHERSNSPLYRMLQVSLINTLKGLKVPTDDVLRICSIFDTNSFEIRDPIGLINIRGLYPMVSLITHDCKINTKHSFHGDNHQMYVVATTNIKKGETITTTYTQTLWCTLARRVHLRETKKFDCICQRCADPTEFGTYAGSILCSSCGEKLVSTSPLQYEADWKCQGCNKAVSSCDIVTLNESIKKEIYEIDKRNPENFEKFLDRYRNLLHSTNCNVLEVKYALTQMYGNMKGYELENISDDLLIRKIGLCEELIEVANLLEPGCSRFRGNLMNDLQAAIVEKTKRDLSQNILTKSEAKCNLQKALKLLEKATAILETEPGMENLLRKNSIALLEKIHHL